MPKHNHVNCEILATEILDGLDAETIEKLAIENLKDFYMGNVEAFNRDAAKVETVDFEDD